MHVSVMYHRLPLTHEVIHRELSAIEYLSL